MRYRNRTVFGLAFAMALTGIFDAASAQESSEISILRDALAKMRAQYEGEIARLEERINSLEARQTVAPQDTASLGPSTVSAAQSTAPAEILGGRPTRGNAFNPSIGVVFNGRFSAFKQDPESFSLPGFPLGGETGPGAEGLALDETEFGFSANADDLFFASVTAALDAGEQGVEVDLEEAYIQTLSLPYGATLKAGRFFPALGYLNENHDHTDDFVDRPLPYQAFLADQYNDEGVQLSVILPTELYIQTGGGVFRGADFPAGGSPNGGVGAYSAFLRLGGDIGFSNNWRAGVSYLHSDAEGRVSGEEGAPIEELLSFDGNSDLLIADFKYQWSPEGNVRQRYVTLQGEYFRRYDDGLFNDIPVSAVDDGFYLQGVYKFAPKYRTGYRFALLDPDGGLPAALAGTALDAMGRKTRSHSVMFDWSNSEYSALRTQFTHEKRGLLTDNRFYIQYILSIGAHGAHNF